MFVQSPTRWSIVIKGKREKFTLPEIIQLRDACDQVLEHRTEDVEKAIACVCAKLEIERRELLSKKRTERIAVARWCVWKILSDAGVSSSEIARQFKKDHSTILHGLKVLATRRESNEAFRKQLAWLEDEKV